MTRNPFHACLFHACHLRLPLSVRDEETKKVSPPSNATKANMLASCLTPAGQRKNAERGPAFRGLQLLRQGGETVLLFHRRLQARLGA
jgi:hypothetical protein